MRMLVMAALLALIEVPPPAGIWQEAPASAFRLYVTPLPLAAVLDRLAAEPSLLRPPGAWTPAALLPLDAFSQTGTYDRSKLARLYGSKRASVARGPRGSAGASEIWTLISPYPSRDIDRLEPGTMLIVLNVALP